MSEEKDLIKNKLKFATPKQIYQYLNDYVIGQEEAKKILSVAVYNHYKRFLINDFNIDETNNNIKIEKSNILLLGNTGTGKTFLIKNIANFLGVPCYIADCTKLSATGYVGDDVENVLVGLLRETDFNIEIAQRGIVILDEVDKLATKSENPSITRDVSGECVQQGLLKIVEGGKVAVPPQGGRKHPQQECIEIDTTNILFIGLGAFSGIDKMIMHRHNNCSVGFNTIKNEIKPITDKNYLNYVETDDLRKFGLIPEFLGRFPIITHTEPLEIEDMVRILEEPKNSIIKQYQRLLNFDNVNVTFDQEALLTIASIALKNKTGARGLRKIIENILTDTMFEYGGSVKKKNIKITNDFIGKYYDISDIILKNKKVA